MSLIERLSDWFWSDSFWLPAGVSFRDLQDRPGFVYAKPLDLLHMPLFALLFTALRALYEKFVSWRIAAYMRIPSERKYPANSERLEAAYAVERIPAPAEMRALAAEVQWAELRVINWFKRRRNLDRPNLRKKFAEASWRFLFYCFAFSFGMAILVRAPWFWDNIECWNDYPRQSLWPSVYFYYMIEGGFYLALACSLMNDVRRKDFNEQIVHHCATLFLIVFSYVANFVRVGSLVMAIHDVSDIFLELAKCFVYAKRRVADDIFTVFAVVFIVSRIFVYPYCVLHTTAVKSMWLYSPYPGYYFFNLLLAVLQGLHCFWAYIIIAMAVRMARVGKLEKDARSDDYEDTVTDGEDENSEENKKKN